MITRALVALLKPVLQRMTGHQDVRRFLDLRNPVRLLVLAALIRIAAVFTVSLLMNRLIRDTSYVLTVAGAVWLVMQTNSIGVTGEVSRPSGKTSDRGRVA